MRRSFEILFPFRLEPAESALAHLILKLNCQGGEMDFGIWLSLVKVTLSTQ